MGQTEQVPLNGDLFQTPEHGSSEAFVVLDLTEYSFDLGHAFTAQDLALIGKQVAAGLGSKLAQAKTHLNTPIALSTSAFRFERAVRTMLTLIVAPFGLIAVLGGVFASVSMESIVFEIVSSVKIRV